MPVAQALYGSTPVALSGNVAITFLSSAVRTATTSSDNQTNYFARGVLVEFKVAAIVDTPSLVLTVETQLPSGDYVALLTATAVTGAGTTVYLVYPNAATAATPITKTAPWPLPFTWRVTVTAGDADAATYSVNAVVLL